MNYEYDSDDTNSVLKWSNSQTIFFWVDTIKVALFLRFSLSENSLNCPYEYYMNIFWLTFTLVTLETDCANKRVVTH